VAPVAGAVAVVATGAVAGAVVEVATGTIAVAVAGVALNEHSPEKNSLGT